MFNTKIVLPKDLNISDIKKLKKVFLNGAIIGFTNLTPENFIEIFHNNEIIKTKNHDISIVYDKIDNEFKIYCDEGRFVRPLLRVKNNKLTILKQSSYVWEDLVKNFDIVFVDAMTQENSVIAMTPKDLLNEKIKYDYCEIHPYVMMGAVASMIPWAEHSQSPRICYECAMAKQALGVSFLNIRNRQDNIIYSLNYPHRQIVSTIGTDILGYNDMPSGTNVIIAVACYGGGNSEDSLILNKASVNRGLFDLTLYYTIEEIESNGQRANIEEKICLPPPNSETFKRRNGNYKKLDENGLPKIGFVFNKGDIIIGKISLQSNKTKDKTIKDISKIIQAGEEGVVDKIFVYRNQSNQKIIKIVMRDMRIIQKGDKLASGCAQKGTIGQIISQEDMPFTCEGIVPDLIINPLAFPSRMTTNMLAEIVWGKKCCIDGTFGDCTPFTEGSKDIATKIVDELGKLGYEKHGWETMTCGITGEILTARILLGVSFYQRLRHQVDDKAHARNTGNITSLTRQSVDGRKSYGGLRLGEMERDALISHGASSVLHERLFLSSDANYIWVCKNCGYQVSPKKECLYCKSDEQYKASLPFAAKLLKMELGAIAIKMTFPV